LVHDFFPPILKTDIIGGKLTNKIAQIIWMKEKIFFFIFLILPIIIITKEMKDLKIDQTLFFEELNPQESKIYKVNNLIPGSTYEIRISYPSTVKFIPFKSRIQHNSP
jgi:uncharacterized membrane protein